MRNFPNVGKLKHFSMEDVTFSKEMLEENSFFFKSEPRSDLFPKSALLQFRENLAFPPLFVILT